MRAPTLLISPWVSTGKVIDAPRTDCPMHLPEAPPAAAQDGCATHLSTGSGAKPAASQLTRRQRRRMEGLARVNRVEMPAVASPHEAEEWIREQEVRHRRASVHEEL